MPGPRGRISILRESVFQHGVASGDPLTDRVVLWTRVTGGGELDVAWELAADPGFRDVLRTGTARALEQHDFCVHVEADGLQPATPYWYRFRCGEETSRTGRTATLPGGEAKHVRFAQVSCAKFNAGFFNAYSRIAEREGLDFLLHLGDYIYEAANVPPAGQTPGADIGRPFEPLHECKTLADYRLRYDQYHRDPDVQAMHAAVPVIATVDDHEFADGAWRGGADAHVEERDGPWVERVANALRARSEWLPVRHPDPGDPLRVYRSVALGNLADLFLLNTRTHRDRPVPPPAMNDPQRTALGAEQREWLFGALDASSATWRLLGNSSVLGTTWREGIPEAVKPALLKTKLIAADGNGPDYDQWDGYPAERARLLEKLRDHPLGNVVVLSGDIHVSLAQELRVRPFDETEEPVAVEFITTSLTSQNLDDKMRWPPRTESIPFETAIRELFPHIKHLDLDSHGYVVVDLTPERLRAEWWLVDTVLERSGGEQLGAALEVEAGRARLLST